MNRKIAFLPLIVFALLVVGLALAVLRHKPEEVSRFASHVGDKAPAVQIAIYQPSKWEGQTYLVNFFASWCEPCHAEHPPLMRVSAQGLRIVGIAYKDTMQAAQRFVLQEGMPYEVMVQDAKGTAAIEWGVSGVPESFLIDKKGVIRWHHAGPLTREIVDEELLPLWRQVK